MWHSVRDEVTTATSGENRPERPERPERPAASSTTVEARLEKLMQENGHLRKQVNFFEGLLENAAMILRMSDSLSAVVSEFNGLLERFNEQWKKDETPQGGT
ncbi:hypothetical protein V2A60_008760 [Cordyceps javanica]